MLQMLREGEMRLIRVEKLHEQGFSIGYGPDGPYVSVAGCANWALDNWF